MTAPVIVNFSEPLANQNTQDQVTFNANAQRNFLEYGAVLASVQAAVGYIESVGDAAFAAVALANFKGAWSSLTGALAKPASVAHDDEVWALLEDIADVTVDEPGVSTKWLLVRESADRVAYGDTTVAAALAAQQAEIDAAEATTAALVATGLGAFKNRLINGSGSVNQRGLTTVGDDAYFVDRWYVLTEAGSVTVAQVTDPEAGATFGFRLTQPDAVAKRMGFAQIIESHNIRQFASAAMTLSARLKMSVAGNIRFAVIEHTGAGDAVTSDVVNNWSSTTYTPSNFFVAGINVISTGVIAPGAGVFGSLANTATLGASVKNVIVFVWTESAVAQNATLEANRVQYERGAQATPFEWRMNELQLCQRYYWQGLPCESINFGSYTTGAYFTSTVRFPVTMRTVPSAASDFTGATLGSVSSPTFGSVNANGGRLLLQSTATNTNVNIAFAAGNYVSASAEL